jgi:Zn-dependent protease
MSPSASPLDIRWRILGTGFRIQPSFWLMSLLFGYVILVWGGFRRAADSPVTYLALWVGCTFVEVMLHEMGHMAAARIFGERSTIILCGTGGLTVGNFMNLARWQRIIVSLAGPGAGFLMYFFLLYMQKQIDTWDPVFIVNHPIMYDAFDFLVLMTLFWNLFQLVPIIPLDGGMVMKELVEWVFRRRGVTLAYSLSLLVALSLIAYSVVVFLQRRGGLNQIPPLPNYRLDPIFTAIMVGMLAVENLTALLSSRSSSSGEAEPTKERAVARRHREYEEKEW